MILEQFQEILLRTFQDHEDRAGRPVQPTQITG